jgi:hypothetical protein
VKRAVLPVLALLATAPAVADGFVTHVDDPKALAAVEKSGFGFGAALGAPDAADLGTLAEQSAAWRDFVATVTADDGLIFLSHTEER